MLKLNIAVFLCDVISLLALVCIVSSNRVSYEMSTLKKQCTVPATLTYEGHFLSELTTTL